MKIMLAASNTDSTMMGILFIINLSRFMVFNENTHLSGEGRVRLLHFQILIVLIILNLFALILIKNSPGFQISSIGIVQESKSLFPKQDS